MQIFVRPHTVDLAPAIQLRNLEAPLPNVWRFLVGPEDSDAPAVIRNDVRLFDIHLEAGVRTSVPSWNDWDTLVHVYRGSAEVNGTALAQAEGALLVNETPVIVTAGSDAILLAFLINRRALLTHAGTIGG
jgi:redox-sensitive bicupin YhaK (pirin superfamily)